MSQKKLTPTIARALAEKVRAELKSRNENTATSIENKIKNSKEYKQLCKLKEQYRALETQMSDLKKALEDKHSTKVADVHLSSYSNQPTYSIYVREHASASVESIKDMILIRDYLSGDITMSPDDLIKSIADELSN